MADVWERLLKERGYKIQHTLGEGAYSKVKSAYSSRLGREVAIKCINTQLAPTDFVEKFLPRELKTLPVLRHDNIVRVYEILEYKPTDTQASDGYVYIVMEAARNGDMLRYIQRKGALPEPEIRHYFNQLVQAVNYCHNQNICHRDLKCENLLLDKDFKLLLTDFGFSKSMTYDQNNRISLSNTFCGSAAYAAPEIIQGQSYDPRMHDMWSVGVILYIMACGHMPFDDSNVKKMLRVQLRNHLKFPPRVTHLLSEDLKNLIRSLIEPNVSQRATMEQVLRHPFLIGDKSSTSSRPVSSSSVAKQIVDFFTGGGQQGASNGPGGQEKRRKTVQNNIEDLQQQAGSSGNNRSHRRNRPEVNQQQANEFRPHSSRGQSRNQPRNSMRSPSDTNQFKGRKTVEKINDCSAATESRYKLRPRYRSHDLNSNPGKLCKRRDDVNNCEIAQCHKFVKKIKQDNDE